MNSMNCCDPSHKKIYLEVFSKLLIRFKGKAQADRESRCSQHTFGYVSIYRRPVMHHSVIGMARIPLRGATQLLGLRWGFETTDRLHVHVLPFFSGIPQQYGIFNPAFSYHSEYFISMGRARYFDLQL
jgi:hypothetical protein